VNDNVDISKFVQSSVRRVVVVDKKRNKTYQGSGINFDDAYYAAILSLIEDNWDLKEKLVRAVHENRQAISSKTP